MEPSIIPRQTVASLIYHIDTTARKDQIVRVLGVYKNYWEPGSIDLLKGGIDPGESALEAAVREAGEELHGVTPELLEKAELTPFTITRAYPPDLAQKVGHTHENISYAIFRFTGNPSSVSPKAEIDEVGWYSAVDLASRIRGETRHGFEQSIGYARQSGKHFPNFVEVASVMYRQTVQVLLFKGDEVLLIRKAHWKPGEYEFPGGEVEHFDSKGPYQREYENTAVRELSEELGIRAHELGLMAYTGIHVIRPFGRRRDFEVYSGKQMIYVTGEYTGDGKFKFDDGLVEAIFVPKANLGRYLRPNTIADSMKALKVAEREIEETREDFSGLHFFFENVPRGIPVLKRSIDTGFEAGWPREYE